MNFIERIKTAVTGRLDPQMVEGILLANGVRYNTIDHTTSIEEPAGDYRARIARQPAVARAATLISSKGAALIRETLFIADDQGNRVEPTPSQRRLLSLLKQAPNPNENAHAFLQGAFLDYLMDGNALLGARLSSAQIVRIDRLVSDTAQIARSPDSDNDYYFGMRVLDPFSQEVFPKMNVAHVRYPNLLGVESVDNRRGFSQGIPEMLYQSLRIGGRLDDFVNEYYDSDVHRLRLALGSDKRLDDKVIASYRKYVNNEAKRKQPFLFLRDGMTPQKIDVAAMDSNAATLQMFQVKAVARAFGIAPHHLAEEKSSVPIEVLHRNLYSTGLEAHVHAFLSEMTHRFLNRINARQGYHFQIDPTFLTRGDTVAITGLINALKGDAQSPMLATSGEIREMIGKSAEMPDDPNEERIRKWLEERQSGMAPPPAEEGGDQMDQGDDDETEDE